MATFSAAVGQSSIYGGGGADTFAFSAAVDGATVDLGAGVDSISFDNVYVNGATIYGGASADTFSGGISAGSSGISFFGGAGDDTFNFSTGVSNGTGTAYFWNADSGVDSINLSGASGSVTQNLGFGVSTGSGLIINFGSTITASPLIPQTCLLSQVRLLEDLSLTRPPQHQLSSLMLVVQLSPSWVVRVSRQASITLDLRRLLLPLLLLRQPSLVGTALFPTFS